LHFRWYDKENVQKIVAGKPLKDICGLPLALAFFDLQAASADPFGEPACIYIGMKSDAIEREDKMVARTFEFITKMNLPFIVFMMQTWWIIPATFE